MPLAAFPLIMRRWRRSILFSGDYAQYQQLREYVSLSFVYAEFTGLVHINIILL